jgi:hypothetical protein
MRLIYLRCRLEWVPGSSRRKLAACFPHHKNEARWDRMPISFELPQSLNDTVLPWVEQGHALLAPGMPMLFVNNSGGQQDSGYLSQWFAALQLRHSAGWRVCARNLRHVFVDERMREERVAGPSNRGAARIMGNCEERWAISYAVNLPSREVQAAAEAMEQWRQELLALTEQQEIIDLVSSDSDSLSD